MLRVALLALTLALARSILFGVGLLGDRWQLMLLIVGGGLIALRLRARLRPRRLPKLHLYSIALARTVDDGPERMRRLLGDLHHHSRKHPIVVAHVADRPEREAASVSDAPRYQFVLGLPESIARSGQAALETAFGGSGCVVRELREPGGYPIYARLLDAWQREAEREEALAATP